MIYFPFHDVIVRLARDMLYMISRILLFYWLFFQPGEWGYVASCYQW